MSSRSPVLRAVLPLALAVCCWFAVAAPALASPPQVSTYQPDNITETTADFTGQVYPYAGATYHFEYGTTKAYGSSTPEASAGAPPPAQPAPIRQTATGLTAGTVYHVRLVGTNSAGEKGYGDDSAFKTLGAPPLPPGGTRSTDTVGPGEKVSTGSKPSGSNPIVMSVSSETGGTFYIDSLPNPDRPGGAPNCKDEPENPDCEPFNPEDESSKTKLWYGPAFRITPPSSAKRFTFVFRIDGDTDLLGGAQWSDAKNPVFTYGPSPYGKNCQLMVARDRLAEVRYFDDGDIELTQTYRCFGLDNELTFDFYNPPWGWSSRSVDANYGTLDAIVDRGFLSAIIDCHQKCARSGTATIAKKTAKALRLKSTTIGTGRSDLDATLRNGDQFKGLSVKLKLSAKVRKALKRASRITISFKLKAVGTKGQVLTKTFKRTYEVSPESQGDDINRKR